MFPEVCRNYCKRGLVVPSADEPIIVLNLDRVARQERDQRRRGGANRSGLRFTFYSRPGQL